MALNDKSSRNSELEDDCQEAKDLGRLVHDIDARQEQDLRDDDDHEEGELEEEPEDGDDVDINIEEELHEDDQDKESVLSVDISAVEDQADIDMASYDEEER